MVIYKITNLINKKIYIGQTTQPLLKRWLEHCSTSKKHKSAINKAILKYGKSNFFIQIVSTCNNINELNHRESYYIKLMNTMSPNGYNLVSGGNNKICSLETKNKISKIHKGKILSKDTKLKISNSQKDINNPRRGQKRSLETRIKMSKIQKECSHMIGKVGFLHHNGTKIMCLNDQRIFGSINEAAKFYNISATPIQLLLQGKRKKLRNGLLFTHLSGVKCNTSNDIININEEFNVS